MWRDIEALSSPIHEQWSPPEAWISHHEQSQSAALRMELQAYRTELRMAVHKLRLREIGVRCPSPERGRSPDRDRFPEHFQSPITAQLRSHHPITSDHHDQIYKEL